MRSERAPQPPPPPPAPPRARAFLHFALPRVKSSWVFGVQAIPGKDISLLMRNCGVMLAATSALLTAGFLLLRLTALLGLGS